MVKRTTETNEMHDGQLTGVWSNPTRGWNLVAETTATWPPQRRLRSLGLWGMQDNPSGSAPRGLEGGLALDVSQRIVPAVGRSLNPPSRGRHLELSDGSLLH